MTTNGIDGDWVALLPIKLSCAEKKVLETVALFGQWASPQNNTDEPEELLNLTERGFLSNERRGETFTRRRSNWDGFDVYQLTTTGRLWLKGCRPAEPDEEPEGEPT